MSGTARTEAEAVSVNDCTIGSPGARHLPSPGQRACVRAVDTSSASTGSAGIGMRVASAGLALSGGALCVTTERMSLRLRLASSSSASRLAARPVDRGVAEVSTAVFAGVRSTSTTGVPPRLASTVTSSARPDPANGEIVWVGALGGVGAALAAGTASSAAAIGVRAHAVRMRRMSVVSVLCVSEMGTDRKEPHLPAHWFHRSARRVPSRTLFVTLFV